MSLYVLFFIISSLLILCIIVANLIKISDVNISEMTSGYIIIDAIKHHNTCMYQFSPSTYIFLKVMLLTGLESTQN